jgi:hypothetical protein
VTSHRSAGTRAAIALCVAWRSADRQNGRQSAIWSGAFAWSWRSALRRRMRIGSRRPPSAPRTRPHSPRECSTEAALQGRLRLAAACLGAEGRVTGIADRQGAARRRGAVDLGAWGEWMWRSRLRALDAARRRGAVDLGCERQRSQRRGRYPVRSVGSFCRSA